MNDRRLSFVAVALALSIGNAPACVVCGVSQQSPLDKIEAAGDVVVVRPISPVASKWQVDRVIKGSRVRPGQSIDISLPMEAPGSDNRRQLRWNRLGEFWSDDGQADDEFLSFASRFIRDTSHQLETDSLQNQIEYVGRFVPYLDHRNHRIAESAHARIASAPYTVLRRLGDRFSPEQLVDRIENESADSRATPDRTGLYITLLGACGGELASKQIDLLLGDRDKKRSAEQLGAILTAHGELHGERTVDLIESQYFRRVDRSLTELSSAIDALRVHGDANDAISRQRVLTAFQWLVRQRTPLLELVVDDCRRWQDWSIAPMLMQVYASESQPWNQTLILDYLRRCPYPEATRLVAESGAQD